MIDYGKPIGTFKGVTFYGDHADSKTGSPVLDLAQTMLHGQTVYYLPNSISFGSDAAGDPKVQLLWYRRNKDKQGNYADSENPEGGLLSLSVQCVAENLEEALDELCAAKKFNRKRIIPMTPDWSDGKVKLFVLDKDSSSDKSSTFVRELLGSTTPSLDSQPTGVFHALLNADGTRSIAAVMKGGGNCLVGFECELEFPAMLPAVDIHMKADLNRCKTITDHYLEAGFSMQYYVDLNLATQLEWLTDKLEESGAVVIDVISPETTPEEKEAVKKLTNDFMEEILKHLFEPAPQMGDKVTVETKKSNAEIISDVANAAGVALDAYGKLKESGKGGDGKSGTPAANAPAATTATTQSAPATNPKPEAPSSNDNAYKASVSPDSFKIGVTYRYKKDQVSFDRDLEVRYKGRHATVKKYRLTAEIGNMKRVTKKDENGQEVEVLKGVNLKECIIEKTLDEMVRKQEVKFSLKHDFASEDSDLTFAEVKVWRKKDVVPADANAIPDLTHVDPYQTLVLGKDAMDAYLEWFLEEGDETGYYYAVRYCFEKQFRNRFDQDQDYCVPVQASSSQEIILRPEESLFYRNYPIDGSDLDFERIKKVEVCLVNPQVSLNETVHLNAKHPTDRFILRSKNPLKVNVVKTYSLLEGDPVVLNTGECVDDEIKVEDPKYDKTFTLSVFGAESSQVKKLYVTAYVKPQERDRASFDETFALSLDADQLKVPVYSGTDEIDFEFTVSLPGKPNVTLPRIEWKPGCPKLVEVDLSSVV